MKNPAALRLGYARDFFDLCGNNPKIKMGGIEFSRCRVPIRIFDKDILRIDPPTIGGDGFLLSGLFCDGDGRPTLKVDKNEWIAYTDSWDVTVKGGVIEIRSGPGDIVLRLAASPPDGIVVDKLRMKFGFVEFYADPNRMLLITPFGIQEFSNIGLDYGTVGLSLFSLNEPWVDPRLNSYAKLVRHHAIYGKDFLHEYLSYLRQTG